MSTGIADIHVSAAGLRGRLHEGARRLNPQIVISASIILGLLITSFVLPPLWPYDPREANVNEALQPPSAAHPFGTDEIGLDIFVRVMYAPRIDLPLAAAGTTLALVLGCAIALGAGFSRGLLGELIMRIADLIQAFPLFVLAVALVTLSGNKLSNIIWVLAFLKTPLFLRLIRSRVLTVRELRYIEAATALGNTKRRLLVRHVLPNSLGPAVVQFGLSMGYSILTIAALAFLGIGIEVPTPEWGSMILVGSRNLTTGQWWTIVFPGIALAIAVGAFNVFAEGVERARALN